MSTNREPDPDGVTRTPPPVEPDKAAGVSYLTRWPVILLIIGVLLALCVCAWLLISFTGLLSPVPPR